MPAGSLIEKPINKSTLLISALGYFDDLCRGESRDLISKPHCVIQMVSAVVLLHAESPLRVKMTMECHPWSLIFLLYDSMNINFEKDFTFIIFHLWLNVFILCYSPFNEES